jgi:hypothetical protein
MLAIMLLYFLCPVLTFFYKVFWYSFTVITPKMTHSIKPVLKLAKSCVQKIFSLSANSISFSDYFSFFFFYNCSLSWLSWTDSKKFFCIVSCQPCNRSHLPNHYQIRKFLFSHTITFLFSSSNNFQISAIHDEFHHLQNLIHGRPTVCVL